MVNILIRIKDEKQPKLRVMVGIAFSPTDGKAPVFDYSMGRVNGRQSGLSIRLILSGAEYHQRLGCH